MNNIEITSPDKILFPKEKIKKIDVIKYYADVAEIMLPYVKNRPLAVIRCHDGIDGKCFFKKHPANDKQIEKFVLDGKEYFYITDVLQLISQAQAGTLEFHVQPFVIKGKLPSVMTFDLDPDEKLPQKELKSAVLKLKEVLDGLALESFLKTSGGKGYHVCVPFDKIKSFESFYDFSKSVAVLLEEKWKNLFTTNVKKEKRKDKIFVDYLRNNRGATCVAPYSLRARKGAGISMPIKWEDIDKVPPGGVNIFNYRKYQSNAWRNFFNTGQKLN